MEWLSVFTTVLTIAMVLVIVLDACTYVIPNTLNLALLALYPFGAYLLGFEWEMALLAGSIMLLVGMTIFALGLMGGGDIKLLAVLTLWIGWHAATLHFLMVTALMGGALVIVVLVLRIVATPVWRALPALKVPRLFLDKQPVPYGIAIAAAFLYMLYSGQIPEMN